MSRVWQMQAAAALVTESQISCLRRVMESI